MADRLDTIFADSEKGGVASALENFFNSVADLSNRPAGEAERAQMLSSGRELAQLLSQKDERLQDLQREVDTRMDETVKEINALASDIADLNSRILRSEASTPGAARSTTSSPARARPTPASRGSPCRVRPRWISPTSWMAGPWPRRCKCATKPSPICAIAWTG
jgi:Tfp pilus assembly protein FimV